MSTWTSIAAADYLHNRKPVPFRIRPADHLHTPLIRVVLVDDVEIELNQHRARRFDVVQKGEFASTCIYRREPSS